MPMIPPSKPLPPVEPPSAAKAASGAAAAGAAAGAVAAGAAAVAGAAAAAAGAAAAGAAGAAAAGAAAAGSAAGKAGDCAQHAAESCPTDKVSVPAGGAAKSHMSFIEKVEQLGHEAAQAIKGHFAHPPEEGLIKNIKEGWTDGRQQIQTALEGLHKHK